MSTNKVGQPISAKAGPSIGAQAARSERVIIAIDLDAFYVAACRKRDPSLLNLPVAIKQKHIVATCSYEARALGVRKLSLIRDAVRQCPDLILVNGEDLSYFRKISNEIFHLVSGMVTGGLVEKLGMDELFCDVTVMVDGMMEDVCDARPPYGVIVPLRSARMLASNGGQTATLERTTQRLLLGTHIAQQIRKRIEECVGLTSSAGISTSKYLAKLVGNTNKPNKQTCLAPLHAASAQAEIQQFLDPFPVRSLNGFGSAITAKMCQTAVQSMGLPERTASAERMTVLVAREIFDWQALQQLFGARLADRLNGLLHGIDDDPVVRAPDFPAQISIEDTYQGLEFDKAPSQFFVLSKSLLRRLETELLSDEIKQIGYDGIRMVERPYDAVGDPLESGESASMFVRDYDLMQEDLADETMGTVKGRRSWKRYPLTMRLSIRQGYTNRISRQTRMPVEIFNLNVSRVDRAYKLVSSCEALFRAMIAQEGDKGQGVNLINIAALELSPHRPAASIGGFFSAGVGMPIDPPATVAPSIAPSVDISFLLELPDDIRAEVAAEYGIDLQTFIEASQGYAGDATVDSHFSQRSDATSSSLIECAFCGASMPSWLQHDHDRWPASGLPPDQLCDIDDDVRWNHEYEDDPLEHW